MKRNIFTNNLDYNESLSILVRKRINFYEFGKAKNYDISEYREIYALNS